MKPNRRLLWVLLGLAALATSGQPASGAEPLAAPPPPPGRLPVAPPKGPWEDADLTDVWFRDTEQGWACGDRGTLLMTNDGGQTWTTQPSSFLGRLECLTMADAQQGWAAGWEIVPYTGLATGVLLRTRDGGQSWIRDQSLVLPPLTWARAFPGGNGWTAGRATSLFPTGIQRTATGGRAWGSVGDPPGNSNSPFRQGEPDGPSESPARPLAWAHGSLADFDHGLLVGPEGELLRCGPQQVVPGQVPGLQGRRVRRVHLAGDGRAWLVGDGGLVLTSPDAGVHWQLPSGWPADESTRAIDFRGLAVRGPRIWVVGTPGSVVFHSSDAGQTWTAQPTGQPLPLESICFASDSQGCAVGALGVVVVTQDGGATWNTVRGKGHRLGLLELALTPEEICWELLAEAAGSQNWRARVELLTPVSPGGFLGGAGLTLATLHQAVLAAGGFGADQVWVNPQREPGGSDTSRVGAAPSGALPTAEPARERILRILAQRIRQWRPEVISVADERLFESGAASQPMRSFAVEAVALAAETSSAPAAERAWLEPWGVRRVVSTRRGGMRGDWNLSAMQWTEGLARSLGETVLQAQGQLGRQVPPMQATVAVRQLQGPQPGRDLKSGIAQRDRGPLRSDETGGRDSPHLAQSLMRQRHIGAILTSLAGQPEESVKLLGEMQRWSQQLDRNSAGWLWFRLGSEYARTGQWSLAAETLTAFARRHRDHPLAPAALVWLVQYGASQEVGHCLKRQSTGVLDPRVARSALESAGFPAEAIGAEPAALPPGPDALPLDLAGAAALPEPGSAVDRSLQAVAAAQVLAQLAPPVHAEPLVRFPMTQWEVQRQSALAAELWGALVETCAGPDWRRAAQVETWLQTGQGTPPPDRVTVTLVDTKPKLDGDLSDPCWQACTPLELRSTQDATCALATQVRLVHDEEFLYWAARCQMPSPGDSGQPGPRRRDQDLADCDRIVLWLDTDRDRQTAFQLMVDQRGWVSDQCWHNEAWNPRWFVATQRGSGFWTIETAIPLAELADPSQLPGGVWAMACQRMVPGCGTWTVPRNQGRTDALSSAGLLFWEFAR